MIKNTDKLAMNDDKRLPGYSGSNHRPPSTEPDAPVSDAGEPGDVSPAVHTRGGRHSAITDTLHNFQSYKIWAEKMKRGFEDEG